MNPDAQKNYFEIAYRTGSDIWTHVPYQAIATQILPPLSQGAFVLDVGAGRGLWLMQLVELGYRVIGLDYISDVVAHGNREIKFQHVEDKARFIYGDVRDLPLADHSFDAVTDIGLLQHLDVSDWNKYIAEIKRVVKQGGYVLNVSLSKETPRFLGFRPKTSSESQFEKFGVSYYFFTDQELNTLFTTAGFQLVAQHIEIFDAKTDPEDSLALIFSLYKAA